MDLGFEVSHNLRAKSFLAGFSLRNGLFFVGVIQVLFGVVMYALIHYLHPSLVFLCWTFLIVNIVCGILGIIGAYKRSVSIEVAYLGVYGLSMILTLCAMLDMGEIIHFFPKAPELHNVSAAVVYTNPHYWGREQALNPKIMGGPAAFIKQPQEPSQDFLIPSTPEDVFQIPQEQQQDVKQHPVKSYEPQQPQTQPPLSQAQPQTQTQPQQTQQPQQQPENKPIESLYDSLPLVPHIGETEGQSEEVSSDELPPETKDLSPEAKSEIVVLYKIQKRPLKFAAAGLLLIAFLFNLYGFWIATTFVVNKCTCIDELASHPEQFTPLVD